MGSVPGRDDPGHEAVGRSPSESDILRQLRHELRTPVNHILSYAELLREEAQDSGLAEFVTVLEDISLAGKQTLTLINELLDPTRREASTVIPPELCDAIDNRLNGIVRRTAMLQAHAQTRGHERLLPDLQRIETASGSLLVLIDEALTRAPISSRTTERAVSVAGPHVGGPGASPAPRTAARRPGPAETVHGSLLVVDDVALNRESLSRMLERLGYSVTQAENGRRALEVLETTNVDLVLLDIMMPEVNGYQVLEQRRDDPRLRDIPFIMISALDELDGVVRCIEMGAEDYLTKPFEPVLLRARVGACLEKKRLRDAEVEYLRQVERVINAATAVEAGRYEPGSLAAVARRADELGRLARVFDAMVAGVRAREERLRTQVSDLGLEIYQALHRELGREPNVSVGKDTPADPRVQRSAAAVPAGDRSPGDLVTGQLFAERFEVLEFIGSGGMGTVYRARDRELGEDVAIKVIRPNLLAGDSTLRERFKTEIRLARRISHENVVRTHDLGEWAGVSFVTMEYVEGITLRELIDTRGHVGVSATLAVARQLARALDAAHDHGVIHRDIKPGNLLLDGAGVLKVMDFGIARLAERTNALTQVGIVLGTPDYMPPEQLLSETVDVRGDLYATGVVLYECLTGRVPFVARSPITLIAKLLHEEPVPPSTLNSEVPPALSALVVRLLAKLPDDRPGSAAELGDLLSQIT
ncbi:MAG: protein kinase domain-containing protein [Gemmatimonadaceae bacterium]